MRCHLIRLTSVPFASRLAKFRWAPFADLRLRHLATKQNAKLTEGARQLRSHFNFLSRLWTKFHKICNNVVDPSYFPTPLSDCLRDVSFRRCSPLSLEVVENRTNVFVFQMFLAPIFRGETTPTFLRQIVNAIYCPSFGNVWLSSVSWSPSAKPGNEVVCRIYVGCVKCRYNFKPYVGQSSRCFATM